MIASPAQQGFSLIEALVALAVLAIATIGLMRTVETHIDSTRSIERRTLAMWVAENRLAELELGLSDANRSDVELLGRQWRVSVDRRATEDRAVDRVRIQVGEAGSNDRLATLDGFVAGAQP